MASKRYTVLFETDAMGSGASWSNRNGAEIRMMQSIQDYLEQRCRCSVVEIKEAGVEPVPAPPASRPAEPIIPKLGRKMRFKN